MCLEVTRCEPNEAAECASDMCRCRGLITAEVPVLRRIVFFLTESACDVGNTKSVSSPDRFSENEVFGMVHVQCCSHGIR